MNENPYDAPNSAAKPGSAPRSIAQWALASIIGIFGVVAVLGNCALLLRRMYETNPIPWHDVPWSFAIWEIELYSFAAFVGVVFIWAARMILKGKWKQGLLVVLVGFALANVNPIVNYQLRRYFAGDSYTIDGPTDRHSGGGSDGAP